MQRCTVLLALLFLYVGYVGTSSAFAETDSAVARGEWLFMNETFGGNGRTCATCHAPENFYTLSPRYIDTLPASDSLFAYRENPDLMCSDGSRSCLEVDEMLRCCALIVTHPTHFPDPPDAPYSQNLHSFWFKLRAIPSLLGFANKLNEFRDAGQTRLIRLGTDGGPAPSVRDFIQKAIKEHMTKTIARQEGIDYRALTDQEAADLEAFLMSLGPPAPSQVKNMWRNSWVETGASRFDDGARRCYQCHGKDLTGRVAPNFFSGWGNLNFNIGVENDTSQAEQVASAIGLLCPGCGLRVDEGRSGEFSTEQAFNTPGLLDVVFTGPYFHNNSANTLSGAIAFYHTDDAKLSPGVQGVASLAPTSPALDPILLTQSDREAITVFLASAGVVFTGIDLALDHLSKPNRLVHIERNVYAWDVARSYVRASWQALVRHGIFPTAVSYLQRAEASIPASDHGKSNKQQEDIAAAITLLQNARSEMVQ